MLKGTIVLLAVACALAFPVEEQPTAAIVIEDEVIAPADVALDADVEDYTEHEHFEAANYLSNHILVHRPKNMGQVNRCQVPEKSKIQMKFESLMNSVNEGIEKVQKGDETHLVFAIHNGHMDLIDINHGNVDNMRTFLLQMQEDAEEFQEYHRQRRGSSCSHLLQGGNPDVELFYYCSYKEAVNRFLFCAHGIYMGTDKQDSIHQVLDRDYFNQTKVANHSEIIVSEPEANPQNDSNVENYLNDNNHQTIDMKCIQAAIDEFSSQQSADDLATAGDNCTEGDQKMKKEKVCEKPWDYRGNRTMGFGQATCTEVIEPFIQFSWPSMCEEMLELMDDETACSLPVHRVALPGYHDTITYGEFIYTMGSSCCLGGRRNTRCDDWAYKHLRPSYAPTAMPSDIPTWSPPP